MFAASRNSVVFRDRVQNLVETPERGACSPAVSRRLITSPLVSMYGTMDKSGWQEIMW